MFLSIAMRNTVLLYFRREPPFATFHSTRVFRAFLSDTFCIQMDSVLSLQKLQGPEGRSQALESWWLSNVGRINFVVYWLTPLRCSWLEHMGQITIKIIIKPSFLFVLYSYFFKKFLLLFYYNCPYFFPHYSSRPCPYPIFQSFSHHQCLFPGVLYTCFLTWPFPFFPLPPLSSCQFLPYIHVSGSILLCLLSSLGSTYRWDHVVFVVHCLAYFT